jgi:F0F1-type ATP synthase membrane subunit b/b'
MIINIAIFVVGFVVGALVARNNQDEVNKVVEEAKELAAKAEAELKELKAKTKEACS